MKVEIIKKIGAKEISNKSIQSAVLFFKKELLKKKILKPSLSHKKLVLSFISPSQMQKLNYQYFKKKKPTDVLSFSPIEEGYLGELALCSEKIKSQAKEHSLSFKEEAMYLTLHGILHLLGYHHEKGGSQAKKMYQIQDFVFSSWQKTLNKK